MRDRRSTPDLPNLNLPFKQDLSVISTGLATFYPSRLLGIQGLQKALRIAHSPTHYFLEIPEMSFNSLIILTEFSSQCLFLILVLDKPCLLRGYILVAKIKQEIG